MTSLVLLACHMVGDYVTQNDWMADRKLVDWRVRALHVTVYTAGFALAAWHAALGPVRSVEFLALVWVTHFVVDSRRWASGERWNLKPLLVDQTIHVATLALLGVLFGMK